MRLTRNLLDAVARGEQPRTLLEKIEREHVEAVCQVCEAEIVAHEAGRLRPGGRSPAAPSDPVERIRRRLGLTEGEIQARERKVRRQVRTILRLAPGRRRGRIKGAYSQYRGALFGVLLLEKARQCFPAEPAEALSLAEAVLVSCEESADYRPDPEIQAPALAVRGNAKRALGRLQDAEDDLSAAKRLLDSPGLTDPATPAEVYSFLGSLRKDQGRFAEAIECLDLATRLYDLMGNGEKEAQVILNLGTFHFRRGDLDAAVAAAEHALACLPEDSRGWLRTSAHFNRAYYLHARGDMDEAETELAAHGHLMETEGPWGRQHLTWLRARIAWSRGDLEESERSYVEVRKLARERGIPFDAALAALELALVLLVQGRTNEVRKLAEEALAILAEQEVEREAAAALELVKAAAHRDALTRELLERTVAALEGASHGPRTVSRAGA